ncbi:MAG: cyclic nucleotide-binding domain-containing protein [Fibrobacter sp.]|nr:cyclic nucleotide-binding domain-containing protein [Fibrobacter sp.]
MDNPVWSFFFPNSAESKSTIELLKSLSVFENVSTRNLVQIERVLHERRYRAGEIVFNEGEPGAGMYIVKKGEVSIEKKISATAGGIRLALISERSFFGELALLDDISRSASAVTTTETVLYGFSKPDLGNIMERDPRLGSRILVNLSRIVCSRLIKANDNLERVQNELNLIKSGAE